MLTILFDGIAYGMLLFLLASGLAVTLGLMNFVNLAHGAFAMAGGYLTAVLSNRLGVPFLVCLPLAFLFSAALGALLEPTLYRRLYRRPHLDQVLFSIGLVFMTVATIDYSFGSTQQFVRIPEFLTQRFEVGGVGIGAYRLFIIVVCGVLTLVLQAILTRTRFGSRLRAAVDDPRVASGLGIDVNRIFLVTFAFGSGLAGSGRRAGCGNPRTRSDVSAQVHDLFPDRGRGRRHDHDHRPPAGVAAARNRRRRRKVLRAEARRVHDLHA